MGDGTGAGDAQHRVLEAELRRAEKRCGCKTAKSADPDRVTVSRADLRDYLDFTNAWLTDRIMQDASDLFSRLSAAAGEVA